MLRVYHSLLITLEHLHQNAGDLASTVGGLLLTFRKTSTVLTLHVLHGALKSVSMLSHVLQSATFDVTKAMTMIKCKKQEIKEFNIESCEEKCARFITELEDQGVYLEHNENDLNATKQQLKSFLQNLSADFDQRLGEDALSFLSALSSLTQSAAHIYQHLTWII